MTGLNAPPEDSSSSGSASSEIGSSLLGGAVRLELGSGVCDCGISAESVSGDASEMDVGGTESCWEADIIKIQINCDAETHSNILA